MRFLFYCLVLVVTFFTKDSYNFHLHKFMLPYFVSGYYLGKHYKIENTSKKHLFFSVVSSLLVFLFLFTFYNKHSFIYTSGIRLIHRSIKQQFKVNLFRWVIGFARSFSIIGVLALLPLESIENNMGKYVSLAHIGKCSLPIYLISNFIFPPLISITIGLYSNYIFVF